MKTKNKALILALSAILLVVATVFTTVAFLTSTASVENTFTFGQVKITLDELKVDTAGTPTDGVTRVASNQYHLLPGHHYKKDPIIHVGEHSENCWLFVKVENGLKNIIDGPDTIEAQLAANGWTLLDGEANIYWYKNVAAKTNNVPVFESFTIKGEITNEVIADYGSKKIIVTAYAVQADGFTSETDAENAKKAWEAAWDAGNFT